MQEKIEEMRRGRQRTRWLGGIISSIDLSISKLQEMVKGAEVWHAAVHGAAKSWTRLSDQTTMDCLNTIRLGGKSIHPVKLR